jgi:hypothetical protein
VVVLLNYKVLIMFCVELPHFETRTFAMHDWKIKSLGSCVDVRGRRDGAREGITRR